MQRGRNTIYQSRSAEASFECSDTIAILELAQVPHSYRSRWVEIDPKTCEQHGELMVCNFQLSLFEWNVGQGIGIKNKVVDALLDLEPDRTDNTKWNKDLKEMMISLVLKIERKRTKMMTEAPTFCIFRHCDQTAETVSSTLMLVAALTHQNNDTYGDGRIYKCGNVSACTGLMSWIPSGCLTSQIPRLAIYAPRR